MSEVAGKGDEGWGTRDATRLEPQVCFRFFFCYYYTNEYLRTNFVTTGVDREWIKTTGTAESFNDSGVFFYCAYI